MSDAQEASVARTTLTIDDDAPAAARAIAQRQRSAPAARNGVPLLARRDDKTSATLAAVNALRDELP